MEELLSAAELQRSFDEAFAREPGEAALERVRVLAVTVAQRPMALRLEEIATLQARRRVVPLPGAASELLGLVGVRDRVLPAFDLAALVGLPRSGEEAWMAVAQAPTPFVVVFDVLEGLREFPATAVVDAVGLDQPHVAGLIEDGSVRRAVVDLSGIAQTLARRFTRAAGRKEEGR